MKRLSIVAFLIFFFSTGCFGQEQDEVFEVIKNLFIAMETNDSTLAATLFTSDAKLHTVFIDEDGLTQRRTNDHQRLVEAFGQPKQQTWTEPIWNEKIEIDGSLASVWVDYAFYIDDQFSHCGVDAFHLINTSEGWKIFHLADTRRKEDCSIPAEIQPD
jgi:hypothetical protein